jgi:hypothetical protein
MGYEEQSFRERDAKDREREPGDYVGCPVDSEPDTADPRERHEGPDGDRDRPPEHATSCVQGSYERKHAPARRSGEGVATRERFARAGHEPIADRWAVAVDELLEDPLRDGSCERDEEDGDRK